MNVLTNLFLLLFVMFDYGTEFKKPPLTIDASVLRSYDTVTVFRRDTTIVKAYDISIIITNNINKPISFWLMKCSWEDNFLINNDYFYFFGKWCDGNYPYVINLKPDESKIFQSTIFKRNHTKYQQVETTRFGLIFIDREHCKNSFDFDNIIGDKSKHDSIIWSNPLYLNKNQ